MTIAVFGSINLDIIAYGVRLPRPGETIHGTSYRLGLGGKGANQAAAVARLGSGTVMIGRTGDDAFAATALDELAAYGVDIGLVLRDASSATGIALIGVDAKGENAITVISGANHGVGPADVERARATLSQAKVLLLQLEVPLVASLAAAQIVRAAGGLVILDPAPAPAEGLTREALAAADLVTPNESETAALLGWTPRTPDDGLGAARELRAKGARTAIVKLGAMGCAVSSPDGDFRVPAFQVTAIDTVAAGDCFNGGLAHALALGLPLAEAVRFAAACGALATTKPGAAAAAPTAQEVTRLLG